MIHKVQLIELFPDIADPLAEDMAENEDMEIDGSQSISEIKNLIKKEYKWAIDIDFIDKKNHYLFWYISAAKLEPRLGERFNEQGAELEQNLGIGKMVNDLYHHILKEKDLSVSVFFIAPSRISGSY